MKGFLVCLFTSSGFHWWHPNVFVVLCLYCLYLILLAVLDFTDCSWFYQLCLILLVKFVSLAVRTRPYWWYLIVLILPDFSSSIVTLVIPAHITCNISYDSCTWCLKASNSFILASFLCSSSTTWLTLPSLYSFLPSFYFGWNELACFDKYCGLCCKNNRHIFITFTRLWSQFWWHGIMMMEAARNDGIASRWWMMMAIFVDAMIVVYQDAGVDGDGIKMMMMMMMKKMMMLSHPGPELDWCRQPP